ncbi:hypothetical protein FQR65_LT13584 [Abscondita terminalis]|nr:hypothetical protein FQR65_LT13584 [Abscondita terminalis]
MMVPIVLVHGGAGDVPYSRKPFKIAGSKKAAIEGYKLLKNGSSALDAVEAAVRSMEDDPMFNAGYGSVLNIEGGVEMDASIMVGNNLNAGCVSIVKDIAHPISLARKVMEKTRHVKLAGDACRKFAKDQGFEILKEGALVTDDSKVILEFYKRHGGEITEISKDDLKPDVGTVGAVAIDQNGMLAAATSTGGMCGKMVGRCSDSSQIGCGTYANKYGAVSTTGYGEAIIKTCLAHSIIKQMESGKTAQEATSASILEMKEQLNKTAGAITISKDGDVGIYYSSQNMSWAYISKNKLHYGIEHDHNEIDLETI